MYQDICKLEKTLPVIRIYIFFTDEKEGGYGEEDLIHFISNKQACIALFNHLG